MMKSTYLIVKYNYETGKEEVKSVCTDKFNALNEIQSMITVYIQEKDGFEKINQDSLLEKYVYSTGKNKKRPEKILEHQPAGHYVVVDSDDHVHKWTVWQRFNVKEIVRGYFGASEQITPKSRKVFDLDLTELPYSAFRSLFKIYRQDCLRNYVNNLVPEDSGDIDEAKNLWGSFTAGLRDTKIFAALKENADNPKEPAVLKVSALLEEHKDEKYIYLKEMINAARDTHDVSRTKEDPMYMSIMDELLSVAELGDTSDSTVTDAPIVPLFLGNVHKVLAHEALDKVHKLRPTKKIEKEIFETDDEGPVNPPWAKLKNPKQKELF